MTGFEANMLLAAYRGQHPSVFEAWQAYAAAIAKFAASFDPA